jgi:glycosidase
MPLNVVAGNESEIVLSDLFYSECYDVTFKENKFIEWHYDSSANLLSIKADENFEGMTLLNFEMNGSNYSIPVHSTIIEKIRFQYKPVRIYNKLTVFGSFNDWNREQYIMSDENEDETFEVEIPLMPGSYQYKFFGDGEEVVDPANPDKVPNGFGDFNSVLVVNERHPGKSFLHIDKYDGNGISFVYEKENQTGNIKKENVTALLNNSVIPSGQIKIDKKENRITIEANAEKLTGENLLRVAVTQNGQTTNVQNVLFVDGKPAGEKFTWHDGIIYSLLIDRFFDGDKSINNPIENDSLYIKANYMGGDLQGIIDKLKEGYFTDLGINIIWISPVYDNPNEAFREYPAPRRWFSGYHGYWPISPTDVEEKFGKMEKVKELVNTAHSKGIKILLDFVSNHVHEQNPLYKEHPDWFGTLELPDGRLNLRHWDEFRLTTWFEPYMPSFDYQNSQEAVDFITDNAVWWLKETGADGFRHDAVKHVPNKFWRALTKKIKKEISVPRNTKVYQVGETFGSYELTSSYVNNGQLDAQFNFNLYNVAQAVFINPEENFEDLDLDMQKTFYYYSPLHVMANIMDSHDKNRYMAYADGDLDLSQWSAIEEGWENPPKVDNVSSYDKAELYLAYMHTIPGLPVIYYGSEFGMTGASDPDNRRMMRFGKDLNENEKAMLNNVKKIVKLRREHSALRYGDYYTVYTGKSCYAFIRSDLNERLLIILNKSEMPKFLDFTPPEFYNISSATDLITDEKIKLINGKAGITVPAIGWRVLKLE